MGDIKELRSVGAIVSDGTWEILRRAEGQSARLPGPPRSEFLRRVQPGDDIPAEIEALVVDLHAYKNLVTLATAYRLFMRKVLFVAATPEEELGLLEFIDPSDDIVRADALESQLAIRIERLVSAPHATRMDALTGLSNRRFITDVAKRAIRDGVDTERPLSLIMVDLDHFKSINDRFGHAVGDTVLKATGLALASSAAGALCVARIGGE